MKFYIADTHFAHENAIGFDNRPFKDTEEMEEVMVQRWNEKVGKGDEVYILGDFAWKGNKGLEIIRKLNGKKFLIKGNHDRVSPEFAKECGYVKDYDVVKDGSSKQFHIVLSHYPIAHWINADYGYIHFYGHIHDGRDSLPFTQYVQMMQKREQPYLSYNVGCMLPHMDYTPRTIYEITGMSEVQLTKLIEKYNRRDNQNA